MNEKQAINEGLGFAGIYNYDKSATKKRIGKKMEMVVEYVRVNPGCSKIDAGRWAWGVRGAEGNMGYIYGPVERAIAAGLITAKKVGNRYALRIADIEKVER